MNNLPFNQIDGDTFYKGQALDSVTVTDPEQAAEHERQIQAICDAARHSKLEEKKSGEKKIGTPKTIVTMQKDETDSVTMLVKIWSHVDARRCVYEIVKMAGMFQCYVPREKDGSYIPMGVPVTERKHALDQCVLHFEYSARWGHMRQTGGRGDG